MKILASVFIYLLTFSVILSEEAKEQAPKTESKESSEIESKPTSISEPKASTQSVASLKKTKKRKRHRKKRKLIVTKVEPETKDEILAKYNITPDSSRPLTCRPQPREDSHSQRAKSARSIDQKAPGNA